MQGGLGNEMSMKDPMFRDAMYRNLEREREVARQYDTERLNGKRKVAKHLLGSVENIGRILIQADRGNITADDALIQIEEEQKKASKLAFGLEWNL